MKWTCEMMKSKSNPMGNDGIKNHDDNGRCSNVKGITYVSNRGIGMSCPNIYMCAKWKRC